MDEHELCSLLSGPPRTQIGNILFVWRMYAKRWVKLAKYHVVIISIIVIFYYYFICVVVMKHEDVRCSSWTWWEIMIFNITCFFFVFSSTGLFVRLLGSFSNFGCLFVGEKNLIPVWLIGADWWLLTAWKLDMLYELWAVAGAETAATDIGEHCLFFLFLSLAGWLSSTDFVSS